jgi:hypothetical protein
MSFYFEEMEGHSLFIERKPWGDINIIGEKVTVSGWTAAYWEEWQGNYVLADRDEDNIPMVKQLTIGVDNGIPIMELTIHGYLSLELGLKQLNDGESIVLGLGRVGGETVFFQKENGTNVIFFKGLRFVQEKKEN